MNVTTRLTRLEARRGRPGQEPDMRHWPFLFRACEREDGSFADEATYATACRRIGPGLAWPSYAEMLSIWQSADEAVAAGRAAYAAARDDSSLCGMRVGSKQY